MSIRHLPQRRELAQDRLGWPYRVLPATAADHAAVRLFLHDQAGRPSPAEFAAQLEAPQHEPDDRFLLLGKNAARRFDVSNSLSGHLRLQWTTLRFGSLNLPCMECRDVAFAADVPLAAQRMVWQRARRQAIEAGAWLLLAAPQVSPAPMDPTWFDLLETPPLQDDPRRVLARLEETREPQPLLPPRHPSHSEIRFWRRVELDALKPLYEQSSKCWNGSSLRTDDHWDWLIRRQGFDRLYVAVYTAKADQAARITGYAVARRRHLLELCSDNARDARALLTRFCQDAMETDEGRVHLELSPSDGLRSVLRQDDTPTFTPRGWRACWLQPHLWLQQLATQAAIRAEADCRPGSFDLGLRVRQGPQTADLKLRVLVQGAQAIVQTGRLGRSYVVCSPEELGGLLLGQPPAVLEYSSLAAQAATGILFPTRPSGLSAWLQAESLAG